MIALLQRVDSASVYINQEKYNSINKGILVFLGIDKNDSINDVQYIIDKMIHLRIFNDQNHKMNLSIQDISGEILLISQFTLLANTKRGRRPSFIDSANPKLANQLYNMFINELETNNLIIKTGQFGAMMDIKLTNSGPATFILNSQI